MFKRAFVENNNFISIFNITNTNMSTEKKHVGNMNPRATY